MAMLHAKSLLGEHGWQENVRLSVEDGKIASLETGVSPAPDDECHAVIVPAMPNLHSHAFQRAMAGLAEMRGTGSDSFWSWRTNMYHFALSMKPDDVEAVASQLYMEMLEAGFSRVGEFHYLHHDHDGSPYAHIGEMADRITSASANTGIDLTLLPVFYAHAGFGGTAPTEGQRRFINSIEQFEKLIAACNETAKTRDGMVVGVAPHSLRAVTPEELTHVSKIAGSNPIHIHIAEQLLEVNDCIKWSGQRPVEWLLNHAEVSDQWCLVHATHMTDDETTRMAQSGAIAGLCPITEGNLGDGTFPAETFLAQGGQFGIGSDSNVQISIPSELRQLEYSQRLQHNSRNAIANISSSTGRTTFDHALKGGARALATDYGIAAGKTANFVSLDTSEASYLSGDHILDAWIFAETIKVEDVWVRGRKVVRQGRHIARDQIAPKFQQTMKNLLAK
ncbi:N-formimino-L-glutamate deiminase [Thalassospira profundimaris]|uniref:N-formimino-L-glutamate deiminase n=1 Tax=Thalassospira profundimaris TaxID=502049 RepID=A0A367WUY4_9PROT|nr:formimidoylglutamate deiminase [Thalassospira profundimaris]RCK45274.1 N-formimino-L-glutamate deiminase [Thalassospira profundimaris]